jgi:peptidoglycan/LPS O-acetylase OafA/YrhL
MHFGMVDIGIIAFFPFILLSAAYNQTRIKRILDTRVLQRLGDWSFAIYMVHMPLIFMSFAFSVYKNPLLFASFIKYVTTKPDYPFGLGACMVLLTLTLIIASLMYRFVEIPSRNYFNKAFKTKHKEVTAESLEV